MRLKHILLIISLFFCSYKYSEAVDLSQKFGIGLGYPYLSLKYGISSSFTSEARWAYGEGINVFSGRGYYNFYQEESITGFTGCDIGYIKFDTEGIKGNGYLLMGFVGGEYFFIKDDFSLGLDIGPAFISLNTREIGQDFSVDGIEWVFNLGLNYYFSFPRIF